MQDLPRKLCKIVQFDTFPIIFGTFWHTNLQEHISFYESINVHIETLAILINMRFSQVCITQYI